jgi:hypothetical protein
VGTEDALSLVREAAAMPRCRFPVNWEAGAAALFPHYPRLWSLCRLLGARAVVAAAEGRQADAVADLEAMLRVARHIGAEPALIGQLVQYACLTAAGSALQGVLESTPLEAEASRGLDEALAAVEVYAPFHAAMQTERAFGMWAFDLARRNPRRLLGEMGHDPDSGLPFRLLADARPLFEPLIKRDQLYFLRRISARITRWQERRPMDPADPLEDPEGFFPWYARISRIFDPALHGAASKRDEAAARLALARCALALDACRRQTGSYPRSLDAAQEMRGRPLPEDPFTGGPFRYRLRGDGYLLYSVGANRQDDGGVNNRHRPPPAAWRRGTMPVIADDIAWALER